MVKASHTLYWFWPQRQRVPFDADEWTPYVEAARDAGIELVLITVDDVDVVVGASATEVHVRGEKVDRARALFHNKLYTWPELSADVWRSLSLFETLRCAGFFVVIPLRWNVVANDKVATRLALRDVPGVRLLPQLAVPTRDFRRLRARPADAGIDYPAIVKPAHWAGGRGVMRVADDAGVTMSLRLAAAAELTMVVEPAVGEARELEDIRVLCVESQPRLAIVRTVGEEGTVANQSAGGSWAIGAVPDDVAPVAAAIARHTGLPWVGVDFLRGPDGEVWLSEVEIDAYMAPEWMREPAMRAVATDRFMAYRRRFEMWSESS